MRVIASLIKSYRSLIVICFILLVFNFGPSWATLAAPPAQAELALISFPSDNDVVRGIISIRGSAVHPQFQRLQVSYAVEPVVQNNQWVTVGIERTDQVVNGELAIWDTTVIPDGSYSLRLRVIRLDGNYAEVEVKQVVVANAVPTETPTPDEPVATRPPAATATPIPPTPTIIIEVPVEETITPTPRPLTITQTLPTPRPDDAGLIPIPRVVVDTDPLKSSCLLGSAGMFAIFLLFGFLSALRMVILGFAQKRQK